ncbi:MAG: tetratricopeptide repeat protein [Candidatus Omnitrophica bacterium]|nr:tetratricopeptide repeat protein [Candidatus Omnitrophota bacterium]
MSIFYCKNLNDPTRKKIKFFIFLAILSGCVFANTLNGEFLFDDLALITENSLLKNPNYLGQLLTNPIGIGAGYDYSFYRPVLMLSLFFDYNLWRENVVGYHIQTILIHLFTAYAVYFFVYTLLADNLAAMITSLLFLIHPVQCENVAYITGRSGSLAALFLLIGFIFYLKQIKKSKFLYTNVYIFSFLLSMLSKETGVIFFPLIILYHLVYKIKIKIRTVFVLSSIISVYYIWRLMIFPLNITAFNKVTQIYQRIPGFFVALSSYFKDLILPWGLHQGNISQIFFYRDYRVFIGIIILFVLIIGWVIFRKIKWFVFFLGWFFVSLSPVSNLFYPASSYKMNHYLYIPVIGLFVIFSKTWLMIRNKIKKKYLLDLPLGFLFIVLAVLAFFNNQNWANPEKFYLKLIDSVPYNFKAYNNLGNVYKTEGNNQKALKFYLQALKINPNHAKTYNNIAMIYYDLGKLDQARTFQEKAIALNPEFGQAYYNLGIIVYEQGFIEQAIGFYEKAIALNPYFSMAHNNLSIMYFVTGQYELAGKHCKKAIELKADVSSDYIQELKKRGFLN